jgi:hypothetical protein
MTPTVILLLALWANVLGVIAAIAAVVAADCRRKWRRVDFFMVDPSATRLVC